MILRQIKDLKDLDHLATEITAKLSQESTIFLIGKLGAGKTTFTKKLISKIGIDEKQIKSPTYTLRRTYKIDNNQIHHIDLYRLDKIDLEEIIGEGINIIEWADKIENYKTENAIIIEIKINEDETRTFKISNLEV